MLKVERVNVYNWHNAVFGMRAAFESWERGDSYYEVPTQPEIDQKTGEVKGMRYVLGPKDRELALRLVSAGDDHGKFLRHVIVSLTITAGAEWWKQMDTYKVGRGDLEWDTLSTSAMHKLGSRYLDTTDFAVDDPYDDDVRRAVALVNDLIRRWRETKDHAVWRKIQKLIPMSYLYTRTVVTNYQTLRRIYHARKNHKLDEWREFCRWMETLPYSELITVPYRKGE